MKRLTLISLLLLPALLLAADLRLTVLDNGLTLYTKEDHSKPLISLVAIVDGSSRTETPDIAGLSHFYEHLKAGMKQSHRLCEEIASPTARHKVLPYGAMTNDTPFTTVS